MSWTIKGRALEHCNCNSVCPCFTSMLAQPGDEDRCTGVIAVHVDEGSADGVDLTGRTAVLVQDAPAMMAEGNWTVGIIVDDGASDEQANALYEIFTGQRGGPMEGFAPLFGTVHPVQRAPIEFHSEGGRHQLVASGQVELELADMVHEGMEQPLQLVGAGLPFGPPVTISPSTRSRVTAFGMDLEQSGKHGTSSSVDWTG